MLYSDNMETSPRSKWDKRASAAGLFCQTKTRRKLTDVILGMGRNNDTDCYQTGDLMDMTDGARASILSHIDFFADAGLLTVKDQPDKYPQYQFRNDTELFDALDELDSALSAVYEENTNEPGGLTHLYNSEGQGDLVDFFVWNCFEWDNPEPLTKSDLAEYTDISRKNIVNNINTIVAYDIVKLNTEFEYDRYQPRQSSRSIWCLTGFNNIMLTSLE